MKGDGREGEEEEGFHGDAAAGNLQSLVNPVISETAEISGK